METAIRSGSTLRGHLYSAVGYLLEDKIEAENKNFIIIFFCVDEMLNSG